MEKIQTFTDTGAVNKIKELADGKVCMLCTYDDFKMLCRPMITAGVDKDGTVWFFSSRKSQKNKQIKFNHEVDLLYTDNVNQHYLVLNGNAEVVWDKNKAEELWNPVINTWFEEGPDDPDLVLLKVIPAEGHYWDINNGKLIGMLMIAAASVNGETAGLTEGDILP